MHIIMSHPRSKISIVLIMLYMLLTTSLARYTGFGEGGAGDKIEANPDKISSPSVPGSEGNPTGSVGSAHGPNWDSGWGWGSSPKGGWGYGYGSGHSPTGFGKGFGFGYGSGSGSGFGYGSGGSGASGYGFGVGGGPHGGGGGGGGGSSGSPLNHG